ncbi:MULTISPECIES: archaeal proteasome endopeptidase complex subunit alpha [Haloarcula]|uniref:Proteasome subunit alpha 1 n=4 Tax=Haloarcula marismortui TaxID=2238 RepID=PSA1_HALMA|nr:MULTISPECIES: archaeal proteasome endopeptidase complex subunit alpha [Haloarcula]Q5V2X8.1 RecName: Full=Proteasome subunit alpha 1; AltName: Full=20S proteasome alpha subunit 1; AltName: Full=Proteasome core protein PsmA 1 [Haloarcula marismortui ATCC 43049]AAV46124.1 proteasome alpha subunit [Haloarcula marismortui ATCC 43049]EMA12403.1 proteasome subunit alpha [Haloarcula californiae ATCC 33799]EMA14078.1 proteasome subunit alpha [Haloarcula sinaiiensis ATCC 33800]NHN63004.1 archaeal pro
MQGQNQQQAYDRGITIFSPDGRLYQVEYAREAVKRGTASIGVRTSDGVVLAVDKRIRSPLMERSSVEKIHKADDHIGIASAGHVADARQLIDFARRQAQVNQLRYGEPVGVETLTKEITDYIQQYTQVGGARPFGVALIIGGIVNGEPRLFETDPSGTPYEWKALAVGADRGDIRDYLEEHYDEGMDLDEGVDLALAALASVNDDELSPEGIGVATVDVETETFGQLTDEEKEAHLAEADLLDTGEDADDEAEDEDATEE